MSVPDNIAFFLSEAVVSLYPAAPDGSAVVGAPVWAGALANNLHGETFRDVMKVMGAGDLYSEEHTLDEEHVLEIERTWFIRRSTPVDFQPGRNQSYVLELVWLDVRANAWYQRQYFAVTARNRRWESYGTNHFTTRQTWRAQRFQDNGGVRVVNRGAAPTYQAYATGGAPVPASLADVYTPLPIVPGSDEQLIPFFREDVLIPGDYLMGTYRWPVDVTLKTVDARAWASVGAPTVLVLELNGVATDVTVTLPAGVANTEVQATGNPISLGNYPVAAGTTVRWQVQSGPDPTNAAWKCSLTLEVAPT